MSTAVFGNVNSFDHNSYFNAVKYDLIEQESLTIASVYPKLRILEPEKYTRFLEDHEDEIRNVQVYSSRSSDRQISEAPSVINNLLWYGDYLVNITICTVNEEKNIEFLDMKKATVAISVYSNGGYFTDNEAMLVKILSDISKESEDLSDSEVMVKFCYQTNGGWTFYERSIDVHTWSSVEKNYPQSSQLELKQLSEISSIEESEGRILIMHGPPGTGKTNYLRSIMHSWKSWADFYVITDPERFLNDPTYLVGLLTFDASKYKIVVLEDCGDLIRADRAQGNAFSRLLNLADGILGQGQKVAFILTTNEHINNLEPALTRPGRCLATLELGPFDEVEASQWLGYTVDRPYTLAELYNTRRGTFIKIVPDREPSHGMYL